MFDWRLENELTYLGKIGIDQSEHAREELQGVPIDEIICSPLKQAIDTTKIIFGNVFLQVDERIKERSHGHYEGCNGSIYRKMGNLRKVTLIRIMTA